MEIISNSSPIIVLTKLKRQYLLRKLFSSVYIPDAVYHEVYTIREKQSPKWITISKIKDHIAVEALDVIVDRGEAEAIILAKEMNIKDILIDDKKAVNLARRLGLNPIRTTALLGIAYKTGLLRDIQKELFRLREKGYWISDYYLNMLLAHYKLKD